MFSLFNRHTKNKSVEFTVSNQTVIRVLALVILSFIFLAALRKTTHALILIGTGLFLALALNAPVHWLAIHLPGKGRGSRTLATAASFLVVIGLLIGFLVSIVPPLVRQTSNFISEAPGLVEDIRSDDNSLGRFVRKYHLEPQIDKLSMQLSDRLTNITGSAFTTAGRIGSSVFSTLTILVVAFMMLVEAERWAIFSKRLIPREKLSHFEHITQDMYRVVKGYVNGQVLLATLAASLILIPLLVLDISYPIALMVIVFICGLIPLVGHTLGAIIVTSVALFHSPVSAFIILAYYILYQQIENYAIQPKIQSNSTNMSPLMVFMSVIVGVSFGGLFGGLVAIPVAGCARILILDYLHSQDLLSAREVEAEITPKD